MILKHWEPVSWRQLKMVYDLPEIDEKISLFHYVNDVHWLFLTYCKYNLLDFEAIVSFITIDLFVSEAEITK